MDCSFFGMSSEYFSAHSQWHYAIISLVSTVSLGSKMSYKMMSTFGKTGMPEDSFRGTTNPKITSTWNSEMSTCIPVIPVFH